MVKWRQPQCPYWKRDIFFGNRCSKNCDADKILDGLMRKFTIEWNDYYYLETTIEEYKKELRERESLI